MSSNSGGVELRSTAKLVGFLDNGRGKRWPWRGTTGELRESLQAGGLAFFGQTLDWSAVFGCLTHKGTVVRYEDDKRSRS